MSQTRIPTDGVVIRSFNIGEADRMVTVLTRQLGVVRAGARGARRAKSGASAAQLLFYADFLFFRGRERYLVDEAAPRRMFLGVRDDLEKLALAQYCCELEDVLAPREENAELFLRLLLNTLAFLEKDARPPALLKAVFEMRILSLAGYMPDLVACAGCGVYEDAGMELLPALGTLRCARCRAADASGGAGMPLPPGALAAMRHAVYAPFARLFAFSLTPDAQAAFSAAAERYLLYTLDRGFQTLDFYRSLREPPLG